MSGWIKMGVGLRRHGKVVTLARVLKADRLRVIGALHAVWCVFDEQSIAGRLVGYDSATMDEEIGWRGFCKAMQGVGWLVEDADGLTVPDYEEHNGPTAKRRALDAQRKGQSRSKPDDDPHPVRSESGHESGQVSASDADRTQNREEKRREEKEESASALSARGAIGLALKAAGLNPMTVNLSDPRVDALIAAGATPEQWQGLAAEALRAGKGSPWAWVLAVFPDRLQSGKAIKPGTRHAGFAGKDYRAGVTDDGYIAAQ